MCQGRPSLTVNKMKMKSLFAPYLSLMHSFKIRADDCIEILKESHYTPIDILREYATLKIDGGRQSGKTKAIAEFAADWLHDGGTVWIISTHQRNSEETARRIRSCYEKELIHQANPEEAKRMIIMDTIRSFLSNGGSKARGRTLNRILYIIEEPMKLPEMEKFYEAHFKGPFYACITQAHATGKEALPLFFVIGMQ